MNASLDTKNITVKIFFETKNIDKDDERFKDTDIYLRVVGRVDIPVELKTLPGNFEIIDNMNSFSLLTSNRLGLPTLKPNSYDIDLNIYTYEEEKPTDITDTIKVLLSLQETIDLNEGQG
jgi:hypothetical protein